MTVPGAGLSCLCMATNRSEEDGGLARCSSLAQVMLLHGQRVLIEGVYDVARVEGSKRLQPATVRLDDGTALLRSYRPVQAEFGFLERRVKLIGSVRSGVDADPTVQQVVAPSVTPEVIELCPGETPWDPIPEQLPVPPLVVASGALGCRAGLWVRAEGVLEAVTHKGGDPWWADARLHLSDGGVVEIPTVPTNHWEPLRGRAVVVTGRVARSPEEATFKLVGPTALESA